jgi:ribonuclease G
MDTWWQTETGGHMITPLPGATDLKPGSATRPFFGVEPQLLDSDGKVLKGATSGNLVIARSWPGQMRGVWGDPERFVNTYFSQIDGRYFTGDGARNLHALEEDTGRRFFFEGSEGLPLEHFTITQEGTREEIETQAVPFSEGDEVHVHIVEPHMYNDDDAVAKVDGYMIEVVNAIPYVGEKKLVLIEEAGRTGARAVLVGPEAEEAAAAAADRAKAAKARARRRPRTPAKAAAPAAPAEPAAEAPAEDETLESKPRRRGRRGGRRRSRAKAEASE